MRHLAVHRCIAVALLAAGALPAVQAQEAAQDGRWRFQATPYVWMSGLEGQVRPFRSAPAADVDKSFAELFESLDAAAFVTATARRGILWGIRELQVQAFTKRPGELGAVETLAKRNLARAIKDPALRAKLTPDYRIGCKRILLSNTYYPALAQPNVDLVAAGLSEIRGNTLVGADGSEVEVDAIIFGTGFHVTDMPIAERVVGADGRTLAETWKVNVSYTNDVWGSGTTGWYYGVGGDWGLPKDFTLSANVGRSVFNDSDVAQDYTDWGVGIGRSFGIAEVSLGYYGTDGKGRDNFGQLADDRLVLAVKIAR